MARKRKRILLNHQISRQFKDVLLIPIAPASHHVSVISGFRRELSENCSRPYFDTWPLETGKIRCAETSVRNRHYQLRNFPEERSSHLQQFSPTTVLTYNSSRLQQFSPTTVLACNSSHLQHFSPTTVLAYNRSRLQQFSPTTVLTYNSSRLQQFSPTTVLTYNSSHLQHFSPTTVLTYNIFLVLGN
jgi:hypothetical protein